MLNGLMSGWYRFNPHACHPLILKLFSQMFDDGRLLLCGSSLPHTIQESTVVAPEMRRQQRRLNNLRNLRQNSRQDPYAMLEALAEEGEDALYLSAEVNWRWGIVPFTSSLSSDSTEGPLVFSLGILLYEIFTGNPLVHDLAQTVDEASSKKWPQKRKRMPLQLPLAIRQLLQWTWEWEDETEGEMKRRLRKQLQGNTFSRRYRRGERRPKVKDLIWLLFWLGHDETHINAPAQYDKKGPHSLSLDGFGPEVIAQLQSGDSEEIDDETRQHLMGLFQETRQRILHKAATTRAFRREQQREKYWQMSRGSTDLESDSSDDSESDSEAEEQPSQRPAVRPSMKRANIFP